MWWAFGWFTAGLVFILVHSYWHVRQSGAVWLLLAFWLVIHTIVHALLFRRFPAWPGIVYLFTMPAEAIALSYVIWKTLNVLPKAVSRRDVGSNA